VALHFAALADALVGLDVGAGRDFLQENLDRFVAFYAFERQRAWGFQHGMARGKKGRF
jgi:hypothetical protein